VVSNLEGLGFYLSRSRSVHCHDVASAVWRPRAASVSRGKGQAGEQGLCQRVGAGRGQRQADRSGEAWSAQREDDKRTHTTCR
jgi:hypothetical protein